MESSYQQASKLVEILTKQEITDSWTETRSCPVSGDGHSFDDKYETEEIEHHTYSPVYGWFKRRKAYNELKRLCEQSDDSNFKIQSKRGLNAEFRPTIPRLIGTTAKYAVTTFFVIGISASIGSCIYNLFTD